MSTTVETIARWAQRLTLTDIPASVLELCRAQRRSVLAAIAASTADAAARRVVAALLQGAPEGSVGVVGSDQRTRVEEGLATASAQSIALDFDDYMCFGHTGHSAVLVPLILGAETGASGDEQLICQVIANEVEARLGAACLLGPLNGQMWSFIHAAGTAIAAGRLLGLDERELAHALAIALYQVPRPTVPGFMAPDSKLLTAADPTLTGLAAARLARGKVTGPLDTLDHPAGFLSAFAFEPLGKMLTGWGTGWATHTLCVKPYPGCAYIDTTIDAIGSLPRVDIEQIESVEIEAGILTCGMDALSREYTAGTPTPVTATFSLAWNAAIALCEGELTPDQVDADFLGLHAPRLASLVQRIRLHHRWELTERTLRCVVPILSPRAVVRPLGLRRLLGAVLAMRRQHHGVDLNAGDLVSFLRYVATSGERNGFEPWNEEALQGFSMTFPARVRVRLESGRVLEAEASVPRGGVGNVRESTESDARALRDAFAV